MAISPGDGRCAACFERLTNDAAEAHQCAAVDNGEGAGLDLPIGTPMGAGRYVVGRALGRGAFGLTYLAWDPRLERRVALKEFLPIDVAGRDKDGRTVRAHSRSQQPVFEYARDRFRNEARLVSRFEHSNIIRVLDFFPDNGTEYMVMEYFPGETLAQYIERHGVIPESAAVGLMCIVLDALTTVHQEHEGERQIHRDMKPSNIYLAAVASNVVPKLLDFGAARNAIGERTRNLTQVLTPGYAPFEQYHARGKQGPWTDVYGCAATLYHMLTAQRPVAAPDRFEGETLAPVRDLVAEISEPTSRAVMAGLELDVDKRPQTATAFRELLETAVTVRHDRDAPPATVAPTIWRRLTGLWRSRGTPTRIFEN